MTTKTLVLAAPVPEPTSLALLSLGGLLHARRRRRETAVVANTRSMGRMS